MRFSYKATDINGKIEIGQEEAATSEQLIIQLKNRGLIPLEIKSGTRQKITWTPKSLGRRFSRQERLNFTQQLAGLLNSGISLEKSLGILNRLAFSKELGEVIGDLRRMLQEGHSFTNALERFPKHFPPLFVSMVKAGETGGILPQVLTRLIRYLEEELNLRNYIISSLVYPVILAAASLGVLLLYVIVVVPTFAPVFAELDTDLPLLTKIVIGFGNGLHRFWWVILLLILSGVIYTTKTLATPEGRLKFDRFKLKIPYLGDVLQKVAMSRMSLSLSMLCSSGVPLLTALESAGQVSGNLVINQALSQVIRDVKQGNTLVSSMASQKVFPILAVEMVGIGEESGNLDGMLDQVAHNYENEVKQTLSVFLAVFEPVLILLMVGIIAALAIAILVPIFNLNSQISPM